MLVIQLILTMDTVIRSPVTRLEVRHTAIKKGGKMLKKFLTIKELAEATGYTRAQIHNQINDGNIQTAFKSSRLCLISRAEFDRVVARCQRGKYWTFKRILRKKSGD